MASTFYIFRLSKIGFFITVKMYLLKSRHLLKNVMCWIKIVCYTLSGNRLNDLDAYCDEIPSEALFFFSLYHLVFDLKSIGVSYLNNELSSDG